MIVAIFLFNLYVLWRVLSLCISAFEKPFHQSTCLTRDTRRRAEPVCRYQLSTGLNESI